MFYIYMQRRFQLFLQIILISPVMRKRSSTVRENAPHQKGYNR